MRISRARFAPKNRAPRSVSFLRKTKGSAAEKQRIWDIIHGLKDEIIAKLEELGRSTFDETVIINISLKFPTSKKGSVFKILDIYINVFETDDFDEETRGDLKGNLRAIDDRRGLNRRSAVFLPRYWIKSVKEAIQRILESKQAELETAVATWKKTGDTKDLYIEIFSRDI